MERVVLTARVVREGDNYIAQIEGLDLEGSGDSVQQAQDNLISSMRAWIEMQDAASSLEEALVEAGFPGADEDTEIQLEFLDNGFP